MKLLKYILTPIVVYLSITSSITLFFFLLPYVINFVLAFQGDGSFWSLFGRWGNLFISTTIGGFTLGFTILPIKIIGGLARQLSPNETFLEYSYWIIGILCSILYLYSIWAEIPLEFYNIVKSFIHSIFLILIIIFVSIAATQD